MSRYRVYREHHQWIFEEIEESSYCLIQPDRGGCDSWADAFAEAFRCATAQEVSR